MDESWRQWRQMAHDTEAPTWALVLAIYAGWAGLTWWWAALPGWVVAPAGAWICAWHMSLQHELLHGHPTRSRTVNGLLGWPPLNLWLPYALYRDEHLRHHRDPHLTDPLEDPESTYVSQEAWASAGPAARALHRACNTLPGRLLLGPACAIARFWLTQMRAAPSTSRTAVWLGHAAGVALVLGWVCGVCRIPLAGYIACFVYPGTALILLRSLAEHQAAPRPEDRTAVVEHAGPLGLLFLNNNLHLLHHAAPSIPWYALPAAWRHARSALLATRHGPVYRSYLEVGARYALHPHHPGPHPASAARACIDQAEQAGATFCEGVT